ncbi:hypothetical protein COJ41_11910 [Bacillus thuringiensis]|uniref:hypothetical protein n=1 Tax=Bacillus thuringiensis TaxID=1428 RepID=UPI000BFA0B87|nr:hypothetical protein [Bacillus thuringiensis]PEY63940.1 hypothetical protein CN352_15035 [Bacillus thuringiensis]PFM24288.1 hypothetical protein COJ41_11910 [Bacillus thuringiensis]PFU01720.1 hypothetical protein COK75_15635 [Bacillus thuringiensis]
MDPIHECAEAVNAHRLIPHTIIKVNANTNEFIGEDAPPFSLSQINLKWPLNLGEFITATQTVGNTSSNHSKKQQSYPSTKQLIDNSAIHISVKIFMIVE